MKDSGKTEEQIQNELAEVRRRIAELESSGIRHKGVENPVQRSEEYFRLLVENASDVIMVLDAGFTVSYMSPSVVQMLGYELEEYIGKQGFDLVHPDDMPSVIEAFRQSIRTSGYSDPIEVRIRHKDGSWRVIQGMANNLLAYSPVAGIVINFRDITELKRAEIKYRQLLEDINDGYAVLQDGKIVFANRRFSEIFEYEPEQVIGKPLPQFVAPDDLSSVVRIYERVIHGQEDAPERLELAGIKRDGTIVQIEGSIRTIQYEDKPAYSVILKDITKRKRAEKALRESEEMYRSLVETADKAREGITIAQNIGDVEGVFVFTNDEFLRITGYTREELIGKTFQDLLPLPAKDVTEWIDRYRKRQAGEEMPCHYELSLIRKDGTMVPVEYSAGLTTYQGKVSTISYIRDITERRLNEETIRESEEKWRSLVENAPNVISLIDRDKRIQFINHLVQGLNVEDVVGNSIYDFIQPEYHQVMKETIDKVFETGETGYCEIEGTGPDGRISYYATRTGAIKSDREVIAVIQISSDITERKQVEEKYRHLVHDMNDGYLVIQEGKIVFANERLGEILGYKPEQMIGMSVFQIIPSIDRQTIMEQYEKVMRGEEMPAERFESMGITKDGKQIIAESSIKVIQYEGKSAFSVVLRDITKRKQAEEALEKRNRELDVLNRIAQSLSQSMKLDDILHIALDSVIELTDLSVGAIFVVDESTEELLVITSRGLSEELDKLVRGTTNVPLGLTFSSNVIEAGKVLVSNSLLEQTEQPYRNVVERDGLQSAVGIPLKSKGKTLGVIALASYSVRSFTDEELSLLESIGGEVGIAVDHARLFEKVSKQSVTDELTGLYNRRHFYKVLDNEIYRAERYHHSFSLVILDLDGFKKYNDKLGHTNGDIVLKSIGETLKSELRKADVAFRYGGDEFIIILPATKADRARVIIDRVRSKWLNTPKVVYPVMENPLGFSAGIAQFPEDAETVGDLIFRADTALYHSKGQGGYQSTMVSELETLQRDILSAATMDQVCALATTVDARDPYMYGHSKRVADISEKVGESLGLTENELANLRAAALVHDIGKLGVPESILGKPADLTRPEWKSIKKHPGEGAKIVGYVNGLADLLPVIRHHHEWYDGTGYPDGLKGEDIPVASRIISVADAYDTMTTQRPYRSVVSPEEAFKELRRCSGTQFDPELVEVLGMVLGVTEK